MKDIRCSYLMASGFNRAPRRRIATEVPMFVFLLCCLMLGVAAASDDNIPSRPVPGDLEPTSRDKVCPAGQYLVGSACEPCPPGTFMTSDMAVNRVKICRPCSQPGPNGQTIVECNATHNTEIACGGGYYRTEGSEPYPWQCNQCSICGVGINLYNDYMIRPCDWTHDTLCCLHDDMVEVDGICSYPSTTSLTPSPHTSTAAHTTRGTSDNSGNSATRIACLLSYNYIMSIAVSLFICKR